MKAVLISIQPKWCEKIIGGEKTVEVQKTRPKLETPFKCYIYCTKGDKDKALLVDGANSHIVHCTDCTRATPVGGYVGNGTVVGEFVCSEIHEDRYYNKKTWELLDNACMDIKDMSDYLAGKETAYFWCISGLKVYQKPRLLSDFRKSCNNGLYCESCAMYCEVQNYCGNAVLMLKRPPQNWCYVKENRYAN